MKVTIKKTKTHSSGRLTKIRQAILDTLDNEKCFLKRRELVDKMKRRNINPDRSTIYRQLLFLEKNNMIIKNTILGIDYYEIPKKHHHHLVCILCGRIERIDMDDHLKKQEEEVIKKKKFRIINHALEFYGYCHKCNG